jgi:hypothetical protein
MENALIVIAGVLANGWILAVLATNVRRARTERRQLEVQTLLIERFESAAELGSFLGTPGGNQFLESILVGREKAIAQVLHAIQAAVVVGFPAIACLLLRDAAPALRGELLVIGGVGLALAAGFLVAALISHRLARRWGLGGGA